MKKMQSGGSKTTKTKYVSPDGNYKGSQTIKESRGRFSEKIREGRTLKGVLKGVEKPDIRPKPISDLPEPEVKMKRGGSVKSAPKMQSGGSTKSVSDMQERGKESITKGTGKFTTGVQTYGPGYKGNPNSPKPFVGAAPAKKKGGSVKAKKK